jgi:hypothetical protein
MKMNALLCGLCVLLTSMAAHADTLTTGTPSDSYDSPAHLTPSPMLGGQIVNFDSLTAFATYSTYRSGEISVSSPDGLEVLPYSTQSGPNELFDTSAAGSANLSIKLGEGVGGIGVGIADSDENALDVPVTIDLQALNSSGVAFGSLFAVTLTETGSNPGNGYFVITDATSDIHGLAITQPVSNAALYSGLAIDDVQITPEPSSFMLLATGLMAAGSFGLMKLKRA